MVRMPGSSNAEKEHRAMGTIHLLQEGDKGDAFMLPECLVMTQVGGFQCSESVCDCNRVVSVSKHCFQSTPAHYDSVPEDTNASLVKRFEL